MNIEHFIDADQVAKVLSITRRQVLDMARDGRLPAHPLGFGNRQRCQWRFLLSEVHEAVKNLKKISANEGFGTISLLGSARSRK